MKYILMTTLFFLIVFPVAVRDVSADVPDAHAETDIDNAKSEQERHQKVINEYVSERNRYIALANSLKGMGSGSLGSLQTTLISSLSTANQTSLANTLALSVRAFLSIYGSSSLSSAVDSAISSASSYHGSAQYLYNNPTRLVGYDAANSAIEAWNKGGQATDHYNRYHSSQSKNAPSAPVGPGNINLPTFECPGACTNTYSTVYEAINAHYEKVRDS